MTNAAFDTESYEQFAEGYFPPPRRDDVVLGSVPDRRVPARRDHGLPAAGHEEQLAFFPPTLIITAEADVLRDEGGAFAAELRRAGVEVTQVRYGGIIHDLVMVNSMHDTPQSRAAVAQAIAHVKRLLEA